MKKHKRIGIIVLILILASFTFIHSYDDASKKSKDLEGVVIILDPGHGGSDTGAIGNTYQSVEKELNLKVALNIKTELEARTKAKVILTRENDVSLLPGASEANELQARVDVAKEYVADIYISIHHDAFEDINARGITFHYDKQSKRGKKLASALENSLFEESIPTHNRGIKSSNYYVLRENTAPAVLLELGFTSNQDDEAMMNRVTFQDKTKKTIVNGIIDYFTK